MTPGSNLNVVYVLPVASYFIHIQKIMAGTRVVAGTETGMSKHPDGNCKMQVHGHAAVDAPQV